ncbi:MAG: hypothetical protein M3421_00805 [Bacteroidota bacterium]|jgi:Ran GTPase-activating protein (RanGAP) involved in mRNA processing and transport|nr:hypothetical protein [Bacteroidota bacterium]
MAKKKQNQKEIPKVNPELEGFDIRIDPFGEIKTNYNIDKINEFLNKNVDDKKLRDRNDIEENRLEENPDEENIIDNQFSEISEDDLENDEVFDDFTDKEEDDNLNSANY